MNDAIGQFGILLAQGSLLLITVLVHRESVKTNDAVQTLVREELKKIVLIELELLRITKKDKGDDS